MLLKKYPIDLKLQKISVSKLSPLLDGMPQLNKI